MTCALSLHRHYKDMYWHASSFLCTVTTLKWIINFNFPLLKFKLMIQVQIKGGGLVQGVSNFFCRFSHLGVSKQKLCQSSLPTIQLFHDICPFLRLDNLPFLQGFTSCQCTKMRLFVSSAMWDKLLALHTETNCQFAKVRYVSSSPE